MYRRVAEFAGTQHAVVDTSQLRTLGAGRGAVHGWVLGGRLHPIHRGVYAVGHAAITREGQEMAAVLACGPGAVVSHRSAAARWNLVRANSKRIDLTAPRARRPRRGIVLHRSRCLTDEDRAVVDGIPVTSVARTIVDLADEVSDPALERAIHQAEVQRLFDLEAIDNALARVPGRRGRHRLKRVLAGYRPEDHAVESEAERRFLGLCRQAGLPEPRKNVLVEGYRVDFLWPEASVAVEIDGAAAHHTARAFREDRARDRALAVAGVQVLRLTPGDLDEGSRVTAELRATLARRERTLSPRYAI